MKTDTTRHGDGNCDRCGCRVKEGEYEAVDGETVCAKCLMTGVPKRIGISAKMRTALEDEGLRLNRCVDERGLYYEATFYVNDHQKLAFIDLRGRDIENERDADEACWQELELCYDSYSVGEEVRVALEAQAYGMIGVPEPDELVDECEREEEELLRFLTVAESIYKRRPVPRRDDESYDTKTDEDDFYVVANARDNRLFWATLGGYHNGAVVDTCCDIFKADRFETLYDVLAFIKRHRREGGVGDGLPIFVKLETKARLFDVPKRDLPDGFSDGENDGDGEKEKEEK